MILAYLTGRYGRTSDSFIRDEVAELRGQGFTVHTFSVRKPAISEAVGEAAARERAATEYVLDAGRKALAVSLLRMILRRPTALVRALRLTAGLTAPGLRNRLWPFFYLVEACWLAERLIALRVAHLHNHIAEGSAAVAMLASELVGIPYSLTVHGPSEFDHPRYLRLDLKVGRAAFTVAISDFTRGQLCRWTHPDDWSRIHVLRCGVDVAALAGRRTKPPHTPVLVCIGRLDEQKGHALLLDALAALVASGVDARLRLVGDGPLRGAISQRVLTHGLSAHVELVGWLDGDGVIDALNDARALVLASFAEGLPIVIMEALALARPVIAPPVAAIPELVHDGVTGWLFPTGSVAALILAMGDAVSCSPARLSQLGSAGARLVAEHHDGAVQGRALAALLDPGRHQRQAGGLAVTRPSSSSASR